MALHAEMINGEIEHVGEDALRLLIASLPAYFYSVHFQNGVAIDTMHSHQCEKVTGYKSAEYARDSGLWLTMVHPADQSAVREFFSTFAKVKPSGKSAGFHPCDLSGKRSPICACTDHYYALEHRIIHKKGMERWIENRFVPAYDGEGNLLRLDGLVTNITERKATEGKLRQSEAMFSSLAKVSPVGIFRIDTKGNCIYVNSRWIQVAGIPLEDALGTGWARAIHPADRGRVFETWNAATRAPKPFKMEYRFMRPDGAISWVVGQAEAERDEAGEVVAYVGTITDITDIKEAEEKLFVAKERAEAATLMKDKFISLVSHDIRAPLSTIIMFQKVTMAVHMDAQCDECKTVLGKSVATCEGILAMADNLLESARLHGANMALNRKMCNVKDICYAAIGDLVHLASKKGIVLKIDVPEDARLYVDRALFTRVVHNLAVNALKFSHQNGVVSISLSTDRENSILAVRDTGVGIDEEFIPDLFKYEVKTTSTGTFGEQGTGLGLPISMDIMKAHGGTISVSTEKGRGTAFFAEVPNIKPVALIADDDEVLVFTIRQYLQSMGMEVVAVENGAEALEIIHDKKPVLLIADIKMPVMDGLTLLKTLKSNGQYSRIPVLIMTGNYADDIEMRQKAFELGAGDFIIKPLSKADFIPRINRFIAG